MSKKPLLERSNVAGGRAGLAGLPASAWCAFFIAGLPLLMGAHIVVNHFVVKKIGLAGILLYPETLFALLFGILPSLSRGRPRKSERSWTALLVLALAIGFWFSVCALEQQAPLRFWTRNVVMGWVVPPAIGIAFRAHLDAAGWRRVRTALLWSAFAAAIATIVLYVLSFGIPRTFTELIFQNRTYRMQFGLKQGISFGELTFGGMNDVATFFGAVFVVLSGWLADRTENRRTALLPVIPILAVEGVCYSRGALLALFGVVALQGLWAARRLRRLPPLFGISAAAVAVLAVLVILPRGAVPYWRNQLAAEEGSTSQVRLHMWGSIGSGQKAKALFESNLPKMSLARMREEALRDLEPEGGPPGLTVEQRFARARERVIRNVGGFRRRLLFGYGLGNYGVVAGTMPEMGVHNFFLDGFLAGGIPGLALVATFWILWLWRLSRLLSPGSAAGSISPLSAGIFLTVVGVIVSIRLVNLGTVALGSLVWLFGSASPSALPSRNADE